jgi:hypothetical protein
MQYREVNIYDCDPRCDQEIPNLNGHIGEEFVGANPKVLQQLKLHTGLHHHLDVLRSIILVWAIRLS